MPTSDTTPKEAIAFGPHLRALRQSASMTLKQVISTSTSCSSFGHTTVL